MAKILLVEDEVNVCTLYQQELEEENHEVMVATDGKKAVQMAKENDPDLVIMDINLPHKMNGLEAMSKMLSENKDLPVIINTGYSQYRDHFMTWAAQAYVLKSGDLEPLKQTINQVLENPRGNQPARGAET